MIDVVIITHNEAANLPYCLESIKGWVRQTFIVDSGSTDDTQRIAESFEACFLHHDWEGYARQKNWALANLPLEAAWVLLLDADEVVTPKLRDRIQAVTDQAPEQVRENGFFVNRLSYFMGRPIRHCGYFPSWNLRLFKRGQGHFEDREVHEHMVIDDPVAYIDEVLLHEDRRGMEHYIAKHNRYSTLEARAIYRDLTAPAHDGEKETVNVPREIRRRRWLKQHAMPHIPFPGFWRFLYMYIVRLGVLDGRTGFAFCSFIGQYDSMVALKLRDLIRQHGLPSNGDASADPRPGAVEGAPPRAVPQGLAIAEGADPAISQPSATEDRGPIQTRPEPSPWSFREKAARAVWMLVGKPLFRLSFHNWHRFRCLLLRLFGAKVGRRVAIRPTVNIEIPWMLQIDDNATVGDHAILYSLGKIHIGERSIISQYAHLCAGTHDYTDHTFKLLRTPVTIGNDAWIGADAFVGPGVHIGSLTVIGARSSVYRDMPAGKVCVGNPAKPIKDRVLR